MLSLFREEEGDEEMEMRKALGLATAEETLSTLPSTTRDLTTPPEPVRPASVAANSTIPVERTVPVSNHASQGQPPMPIRQPSQIPSIATNAAQSIASYSSTAPAQTVPASSTAHIAASSNQRQIDTLQGQGPPVPSHPTPSTETTPIPAPFTSVIQPPTTGPSNVPPPASVPETRPQGVVPMDEDDEDEPMPPINMDSDSDADS
ncbi:uncharacterized protein B0H18DRAFT_12194 [Fomitopsis serialis]|uniref:uncharacterized protein n=1 Tax=Fomitopsis serialis TaxID=139415 RepID=UPI00200758AA|nr:uncharacterized protein B0H18DRAFT_12194 [Neoantrodia serialis]KAH9938363.1 hypothetical protein B0H18DRAFT_12194 [Neoantrodia serialis]